MSLLKKDHASTFSSYPNSMNHNQMMIVVSQNTTLHVSKFLKYKNTMFYKNIMKSDIQSPSRTSILIYRVIFLTGPPLNLLSVGWNVTDFKKTLEFFIEKVRKKIFFLFLAYPPPQIDVQREIKADADFLCQFLLELNISMDPSIVLCNVFAHRLLYL